MKVKPNSLEMLYDSDLLDQLHQVALMIDLSHQLMRELSHDNNYFSYIVYTGNI